MKLITKEIEQKLLANPCGSHDGEGLDAKVIVKFFGGCCCTWLVTEADKEGDDWYMFGYVNIGYGWEWGYFMFSEISSIAFPPFGLPLERDMYSEGTVRELARG